MTELQRLVQKHRQNGLLIDSNLLLLLLIGDTNENRISQFDRTAQYTIKEYRLLRDLVRQFKTTVTTPHVLTEVSNLAKLWGPELISMRAKFREMVQRTEEFYDSSRAVMADIAFEKFGLTDAAIRLIAQRPVLVVTDELPMYHYLSRLGIDVINLNHFRS